MEENIKENIDKRQWMEIGERLRYEMERKNISIKELSERAHISVPTLKRYINGLHSPSHFPAGKMAIVLNMASDWLRGLDVTMENPRNANDIYAPANALISKIFENDDLEKIVTILADMPSDKLKLVKEMIKNL